MARPVWSISGKFYETCSCDFVCPCFPTGLTILPTKGSCTFAMAFHIDRGQYGNVPLGGLGFIIVGFTPEEMGKGNWSVGLIADERATHDQRNAITAIVSGSAGGPMSALAGLIENFLGVEFSPMSFEQSGVKWSVKASGFVDMAAEGAKGLSSKAVEPLYLDNTGHPAAERLSLALASASHVHAFGLAWDDVGGRNNGHYAQFSWRST
jgi:hypothetical protein